MSGSEITSALALWGAITGTIGTLAGVANFYIRHKQHHLNKARLVAESSFKFHHPPSHDHEIVIRSIGRRPVTLSSIRYFARPVGFWNKIFRKKQHNAGRWIWDQDFGHNKPTINEGRKLEVRPKLPDGLEFIDIYKAKVIDDIGREWPIKWPSKSFLEKNATCEIIDELKDSKNNREIELKGYKAANRFYLATLFKRIPQPTGVRFGKNYWFNSEKEYKEKFTQLKDCDINKFLSGEIDEWE